MFNRITIVKLRLFNYNCGITQTTLPPSHPTPELLTNYICYILNHVNCLPLFEVVNPNPDTFLNQRVTSSIKLNSRPPYSA